MPSVDDRLEITGGEIVNTLDTALQENIAAYAAQLHDLLRHSAGKYVVFAEAKLFRICDTLETASALGYAEFGRRPFMLQRIEPLPHSVDFHLACRG